MKKRLTIADYQEANAKLVEERATLTRERDEARRERDDARSALVDDRNDLLDLLGGRNHYGDGILSRQSATKVQIARRAGELVAHERLSERFGRMFFDDDVRIEGVPTDMTSFGVGKRFAHDIEHNHGSKSIEELAAIVVGDIQKKRGKRAGRSLITFLIFISMCVALGFFVGTVFF